MLRPPPSGRGHAGNGEWLVLGSGLLEEWMGEKTRGLRLATMEMSTAFAIGAEEGAAPQLARTGPATERRYGGYLDMRAACLVSRMVRPDNSLRRFKRLGGAVCYLVILRI